MEDEEAPLDKVPCEATQQRRGIGLIREYVTTDHSVEARIESHLCRIALAESNVRKTSGSSGDCRRCDSGGGRIGANHVASGADDFGREKRDFAGAAPDVEHAHTLPDSSFSEELPGDRLEKARLGTKPVHLVIGVTQDVRGIRFCLARHRLVSVTL